MRSESRSYRSFLYVPGDAADKLDHASSRGAHAIILDLEDSVVPAKKRQALDDAVERLGCSNEAMSSWWVRVNSGDDGLVDLDALLESPLLDGVWLPKVEPGPWLTEALAMISSRPGLKTGVLIETAIGLRNLQNLPDLPEDALLQLGEVDLAASLRMRDRSPSAMYAFRMQLVLECASRNLPSPVAPVSTSLDQIEAFESETEQLRGLGFGSRACIHPKQVRAVNKVFEVSASEIDDANAMIREFEERGAGGAGAFVSSSGTMADAATVRMAREIAVGGNSGQPRRNE